MKTCRLLVFLCLWAVLLPSCKKEHYDVTHVQGVDAEGELLLPLVSKSFSMMTMLERFQIDSLISCTESGDLSFNFYLEDYDVVSGDKLLRFKDMEFTDHYAFVNPFIVQVPPVMDTMLSLQKIIVFESDEVSVMEAVMKTGNLSFHMETNLGDLNRVVIHSSDIRDASGHDFVLDQQVDNNTFGFDLTDLNYQTETANTLALDIQLYCTLHPTTEPELFVDFNIQGRDLAMHSMRGFVETHGNRNRLDTVFSLFPDDIGGVLDVKDANMRLSERNSFPIGARLVVDTAWVSGEGLAPYSIFEPMPLCADLPPQMAFGEVIGQSLNGRINANGGSLFVSSDFIVNPEGENEMVTVTDTCGIDVRVDVEVPFAFRVDDVSYLDTVEVNFSELELPDMIEQLTLELSFTSTLPLNMTGHFYMYDSENDVITDELLPDAQLIQASFDGQPATTNVSIDITEERVERVMKSDRIIMVYHLDTDAHDVKLNVNQMLEIFMKAKVKYDGVVELKN